MFIENEFVTYELIDGILHVRYKEIILDLPAAVTIVNDRMAIHEGRFLPVLCDIRLIKEGNKAARDYLSLEGSTFISAVAFIVDSPVSTMLSEFYVRASKPPIPTKAFVHVTEALLFLKQFQKQNPS